jgi:hypothetical protein
MPPEHRVIVCGSREWTDRALIHDTLAALTEHAGRVVIVHGAARGADRIAGEEARALGLDVEEHPADWRRDGRRAGLFRNARMLSLGCSRVIAFWDGYSRGTEHMMRIAREAEARVTVIRERAKAGDRG